jgi:hypothetical protein
MADFLCWLYIIAKMLYKKLKVLKSCAFFEIFRDFQQPALDKNLRKIATFLYMVQVCNQKYIKDIFHKKKSYLACNQIWLNLLVDDHHFGYNTQLPPHKNTGTSTSNLESPSV